MSKVSKKIFSFFMALVILITSNGIVLASHTCLKKSDTKVSLFKSKDCCNKAGKSCDSEECDSIKDNCCLSSVSYHKVTVNTVLVQKQDAGIHLVAAPVSLFHSVKAPAFIPVATISKPPLLSSGGNDLLKQYSVFRI